MKILAIGGGGFTSASHPGLDDAVLSLVEGWTRRVGYVGTASDDDPVRVENFYKRIAPRVSAASVMPAFAGAPEAAKWIGQHDLIYVGGGDTTRMLQKWRATGFDKVLRDAGHDGVILAGVSAGAVCWFDAALVRGASGGLERIECLGFLKGSICAHFSSDEERRAAFTDHISRDMIPPGIGVDDGVGVMFRDGSEAGAFSAEPPRWAYRFERDLRGRVACSRLPAFVKG